MRTLLNLSLGPHMRRPRSVAWRSLAGMLLLAGSISNLLAGCGAPSSPAVSRASATPTPPDQVTLYAGFAAGYLIAFRASDGTVRWRIKGYTESPVVADGILYTASGADLVALRPQSDGVTEVWRTLLDTTALTSTPVLRDGILYVNTSGLTADRSAPNGSVYAVDANTGHILWRFQTHGSMFSAPVVTADAVYTSAELTNVASALFALNRADGALRWHEQRNGYLSNLDVVGRTLYAGSTDKTVAALRVSDGTQLWSYSTQGYIDSLTVTEGTETAGAGIVYAASQDKILHALRVTDGAALWTYQAGGFILAQVAVRDGLVYVASENGYVAALDATTGRVRWRTCVDNDTCTTPGGAIHFATPLVTGQVIYVGVGFIGSEEAMVTYGEVAGGIYALDAESGGIRWQYQNGIVGAAMGAPALTDG